MKLLELVVVFVALLSAAALPTFLFASNVDADEYQKTGASAALIAALMAVYKIWRKPVANDQQDD